MDCVARQAPPFTEVPRQEHWSGLLFPSPGDPPDPGIKLGLPELLVPGERGESCTVLAALEEAPCGLLWAASTGSVVCLLVNVLVFSLSP